MKACLKSPFILGALIAGLGLILAGQVTAQTLRILHSFGPLVLNGSTRTNNDGAFPYGRLILSGNILYGTAVNGGEWGGGTVFAVNTDGTGFTILHNFTGSSGGVFPQGALILSGNTLYGTASDGPSASSERGTVFSVNSDGTGFTVLHEFSPDSDGAVPLAGLVLSDNTLYGTAVAGGGSGNGTIFKVNSDGTGFTVLHVFTGGVTNADGAYPQGGLILSGDTLYGTAMYGGSWGNGTVFALKSDGSSFRTLYNFAAAVSYYTNEFGGIFSSNPDGTGPVGRLVLSGNTLYGMTSAGGRLAFGTVFAVNTDSTGFTVLHNFTATNSDGREPTDGLVLSGSTLFGTTIGGGDSDNGMVFALNTDGTGFTTLHSFTARSDSSFGFYTNRDGVEPQGGLALSGNALYGTAVYGGSSASGTMFIISFTPQLSIISSGANVILSWPTNFAGFDYTGYTLQSTANLVSPVWTTNSPAPIVVNGQYTVTNPISGRQQFFRLSQ